MTLLLGLTGLMAIGGVLFDVSGHESSFAVSAGVLLIAAFLDCLTSRSNQVQTA